MWPCPLLLVLAGSDPLVAVRLVRRPRLLDLALPEVCGEGTLREPWEGYLSDLAPAAAKTEAVIPYSRRQAEVWEALLCMAQVVPVALETPVASPRRPHLMGLAAGALAVPEPVALHEQGEMVPAVPC